jgi:hypothetical protein
LPPYGYLGIGSFGLSSPKGQGSDRKPHVLFGDRDRVFGRRFYRLAFLRPRVKVRRSARKGVGSSVPHTLDGSEGAKVLAVPLFGFPSAGSVLTVPPSARFLRSKGFPTVIVLATRQGVRPWTVPQRFKGPRGPPASSWRLGFFGSASEGPRARKGVRSAP